MKKTLCLLLCAVMLISVVSLGGCARSKSTADVTKDNNFKLSAIEFIQGIKLGWNLGNTLEAYYAWGGIPKENATVEQVECGWNNPKTTQAMFDKLYDTGFNAVRLPVTWSNFVTEQDGKYAIKDEWSDRVREIVGYAVKKNMYVILDMHHDDKIWLDMNASDAEWKKQLTKYNALWTIIAGQYKDYNERLILEAVNEPLGNKEDGQQDWWGEDAAFVRLNELYQNFVDTVRATGGNNAKRYLMLPSYGAQWYDHQLDNIKIPNNDDHLIVDVHCYKEKADEAELASIFNTIKKCTLDYDIAMLMGETGIRNDAAEHEKLAWAGRYIEQAAQLGIRCFLWDDGGDYLVMNRKTATWSSNPFISAVVKAAAAVPVQTTTQDEQQETDQSEFKGYTLPEKTTAAKKYVATDSVYYNWGTSDYCKTEGWMNGAKNLEPAKFTVVDGTLTFNLSNFKSSQLNTAWKCGSDKNAMASVLAKAKQGSGKLIFTVTLLSALDLNGNETELQIKTNLGGAYNENDDVTVKAGEKKQVVIDVSTLSEPSDFVILFMNFQQNLSQLRLLVSSINVAKEK